MDFFFFTALPYCTVLCVGKEEMLVTVSDRGDVRLDGLRGCVLCSHCVVLLFKRTEDQFCIFVLDSFLVSIAQCHFLWLDGHTL